MDEVTTMLGPFLKLRALYLRDFEGNQKARVVLPHGCNTPVVSRINLHAFVCPDLSCRAVSCRVVSCRVVSCRVFALTLCSSYIYVVVSCRVVWSCCALSSLGLVMSSM